MFVVTVVFEVQPDRVAQFRQAVMAQAKNTLEGETQCARFDVSVDGHDPARFFLYELYADEAAFQFHLLTEHFQRFDDTVRAWVASKEVRSGLLLSD